MGVRNKPSAERGPKPISEMRQPQMTMTAGVRQVIALDVIAFDIDGLSSIGWTGSDQAGATAGRTTGFSTIGRLITAERTPSRIESHHTTS